MRQRWRIQLCPNIDERDYQSFDGRVIYSCFTQSDMGLPPHAAVSWWQASVEEWQIRGNLSLCAEG